MDNWKNYNRTFKGTEHRLGALRDLKCLIG